MLLSGIQQTLEGGQMENNLTQYELNQYGNLTKSLAVINEEIADITYELTELNSYNLNISPVYTGMPSGNAMRDKIADFLFDLETDRDKLNDRLASLTADRALLEQRLCKMRKAVADISDRKMREIITLHYICLHSVEDIAEHYCVSSKTIYNKLYLFFMPNAADVQNVCDDKSVAGVYKQ